MEVTRPGTARTEFDSVYMTGMDNHALVVAAISLMTEYIVCRGAMHIAPRLSSFLWPAPRVPIPGWYKWFLCFLPLYMQIGHMGGECCLLRSLPSPGVSCQRGSLTLVPSPASVRGVGGF